MVGKLEKICCEICDEPNRKILEIHHIIEQTDPRCTNHPMNLCVICPSCHAKHHAGSLKILGILPSTSLPYKRTVIFDKDGIRNIPEITEEDLEYFRPKPKKMKYHGK